MAHDISVQLPCCVFRQVLYMFVSAGTRTSRWCCHTSITASPTSSLSSPSKSSKTTGRDLRPIRFSATRPSCRRCVRGRHRRRWRRTVTATVPAVLHIRTHITAALHTTSHLNCSQHQRTTHKGHHREQLIRWQNRQHSRRLTW